MKQLNLSFRWISSSHSRPIRVSKNRNTSTTQQAMLKTSLLQTAAGATTPMFACLPNKSSMFLIVLYISYMLHLLRPRPGFLSVFIFHFVRVRRWLFPLLSTRWYFESVNACSFLPLTLYPWMSSVYALRSLACSQDCIFSCCSFKMSLCSLIESIIDSNFISFILSSVFLFPPPMLWLLRICECTMMTVSSNPFHDLQSIMHVGCECIHSQTLFIPILRLRPCWAHSALFLHFGFLSASWLFSQVWSVRNCRRISGKFSKRAVIYNWERCHLQNRKVVTNRMFSSFTKWYIWSLSWYL